MASTARHLRARLLKLLFASHKVVYEWSDGRVGANLGLPMLLLTTRGRTTGIERTTPLAYMRDGERFVVVASDGAARRNPQWFKNLEKDPRATIRVGRAKFAVRAREAEGDERERLWERGRSFNPAWSDYQKKTERRIPVVVLERAR